MNVKQTPVSVAWSHLYKMAKVIESKDHLSPFVVYAKDWDDEYVVELDIRRGFEPEMFANAAADLLDKWSEELGIGVFPVDHAIWSTGKRILICIRPVVPGK